MVESWKWEKPFERDVCLLQLNLPQKIATFASRRQRTSTKERGRSCKKTNQAAIIQWQRQCHVINHIASPDRSRKHSTFLSRVPVHCITPFCWDALVSPPNLYPPCSKQMNLRSFKLNRVYVDPLNVSNAGDFSWSWMRKDFIQVHREDGKFVVVCPRPP